MKKILIKCVLVAICILLTTKINAQLGNIPLHIVLTQDDKSAFAHAPTGFDQKKENILRGKTDSVQYYSKTMGTIRKLLISTPPGYLLGKKYPVLYLLYGIGGNEKEWYKYAEPNVILDNLYAYDKLTSMILVFHNGRAIINDANTGNIYSDEKIKGFANFERDLLDHVIPFIKNKYPVNLDRDNRAIAGYFMVSRQSLNFGLGNLNVFANIGGFSSAPNTKSPSQLIPSPTEIMRKLKLLYLSCVNKDSLSNISQNFHHYLLNNNVPHIYQLSVRLKRQTT